MSDKIFIKGREMFHGLHSPGLNLDGYVMHNKLLDGYAKAHKYRQNNWSSSTEG